MRDVLLIGSGGREHALAWKLKQSSRLGKLYIAPGNAGTSALGENIPIGVMEFERLADFAQEKKIGLTIVGPDDPLGEGIIDIFKARGLRIWGPTKAAAQIESSKSFAKQLMRDAGVPTAEFGIFTEYEKALTYVHEKGVPIVVKASGLALGKGVYVCMNMGDAESALKDIMVDRMFGDSGNEVVVEEFLDGPEISIHAISDGTTYLMFPPSQDHKRVFDNDEGKNTGGMGVVGPLTWVSAAHMKDIENSVVRPTFDALAARGVEFSGILYPGLIMSSKGPRVLEYNARFGDPECEVYMRLMKSDILDILSASADGTLAGQTLEWNSGFACCITISSRGYPETSEKGVVIAGVEEANRVEGVVVFNMATALDGGILKTAGGRVLGVSAIGDTLKQALDRAYEAVGKIHFDGMHFRHDIGARSL